MPQPTALIISTGCMSNLLDGGRLEQMVSAAGYRLVSQVDRADLVFINTCAFNQVKENESIGLIEQCAARMRNGGRLVVCGCLPKINRARLRRIHDDLIFGPRDIERLPEFLSEILSVPDYNPGPISYSQYSSLKKAVFQTKRIVESVPVMNRLPVVRRLLTPLFNYSDEVCCIKVATGCTGKCTYCAIRFAKGACVSRPMTEILDDLHLAREQGYSEFILVGDEITAYGSDINDGISIIDVVNIFLTEPGVKRLYLESFEPGFMISHFDQIAAVLHRGKTPVFCSSAQSGSDRILRDMRRQYLAEDYRRCMIEIKRRFPRIYLRNEMIVGFPGESENDFEQSLKLVADLRADFTDVYQYEDRPRTPASKMQNKIPTKTKRRRQKKLLAQHYKNIFLKKRRPRSAASDRT